MAGPGATSCFPPFPLSHSSRPLSTFRGRLSLGPVPGLGENGVYSGPAKPGLGCQPSQTISLQAVVLGRVPVPMGCISCSPWLPDEPQKGAARGGKELCLCLREPVWGLKTVYQLCGPSPSAGCQPPAERARSPKFHSPCVGRAAPQLHQAGVAKEANHEKESPSHSHHRESSLMGKPRKTHSGQADVQEQQLQGKF